ncbi:hypothetical protein phiV141_18 [Vibrio phage phiV141]|uniref:Uncharacterized protein n=1 Tax=Vibrio phage phiV141 TaxID=2723905 RepID=A0A7D7J5W7_9CAUD|nr:hypothetical protein phiV141_18 [Vibrio phage phiV141]
MQFTQEQVDWYNAVVNSGQMTHDQAMAALQAAMQPQAPVQAPVEQVAQPVQGAASHQVMGAVAQPTAANNMLAAFQAIGDAAALEEDHSAIISGKPPAAGLAWLRVKGYIEIGTHQGKNTTYAPKPICLVIVELNTPQHMKTFDGVSEPTEMTIRVSKTHSQNSKFPKFFKALARALGNHPVTGQPITHLSQAIGMGCLAEVYHNKVEDKVYANLDLEGAWSFKPSTYPDPATGQMMSVDIPPLQGEPLLFLMDNHEVNKNPEMVKQMWDSIYIDGVRTSKDAAGNEKTTSLNYFQELIAKGLNWVTSETKRILDAQGCQTTFGDSSETQPSSGSVGAPTLGAVAQPAATAQHVPQAAPAVAPVQQPVVQATTAAVQPTAVPTAQPVAAPVHQPVAQPEQVAHAAPSVGVPVAGVPQVQQAAEQVAAVPQAAGVPQAQPSVGAPTAAPMSAADFMNQFQPVQ